MAMIRTNFARIVTPGLHNVIEQGYEQPEDHLDKFFNVEDSVRAFEEEFGVTGLGLYQQTEELGPTPYDDKLPRFYKRYDHLKYVLGVAMSSEMYEDDLYGVIRRYGLDMGRSAKETPQIVAFNVFNRAFDAAYAGPDGVALCATNHPRVGGSGTQSNRPAVAADLHKVALQQAEVDMLNWTTDKGLKVPFKPRVLLVSTQNKAKAWELTNSEYNPEAVERSRNYIKSMGLEWAWVPYITLTTGWFVLAAKQFTHVRYWWRKKNSLKFWEDEDRGALRARGEMRFSVGFSDWFGVWGSPGL